MGSKVKIDNEEKALEINALQAQSQEDHDGSLKSWVNQSGAAFARQIAPARVRFQELIQFIIDGFEKSVGLFQSWRESFVRAHISEAADVASVVLPTGGRGGGWDRAASKGLQARELLRDRRLDIRRTISATISKGGFLEAHWRPRSRSIQFLFLVHRRSRGDLEYKRISTMLAQLRANGANLAEYVYTHDPRAVFEVSQRHFGALSLETLFDRHPHARMIIVSDGEELVDPMSLQPVAWLRQLECWPERLLLTPIPQDAWADVETGLIDVGFFVASSQAETFADLGRIFRYEDAPFAQASSLPSAAAAYFFDSPSVASDAPPSATERAAIVMALRRHLGPRGIEWLAACCYYPELRPELVSALAGQLGIAAGDTGDARLTDLGARMSSLPWFRRGYLPEWLRISVIDSLPANRQRAINAVVTKLFDDAQPSFEAASEVLSSGEFGGGGATRLPIRLAGKNPEDGITIDAVTIGLLARGDLRRISIALSRRKLREWRALLEQNAREAAAARTVLSEPKEASKQLSPEFGAD